LEANHLISITNTTSINNRRTGRKKLIVGEISFDSASGYTEKWMFLKLKAGSTDGKLAKKLGF